MGSDESSDPRATRRERDREVREGIEFMQKIIRACAKGRLDDAEVLGLSHLCWIGYARARERSPVRDPRKLMSHIAWVRTRSELKKKQKLREHMPITSLDAQGDEGGPPREVPDLTPPPDVRHERATELLFATQEILRHSRKPCREVIQAMLCFNFEREAVAAYFAKPYNSLVVELNRCLDHVRKVLVLDRGSLARILKDMRNEP